MINRECVKDCVASLTASEAALLDCVVLSKNYEQKVAEMQTAATAIAEFDQLIKAIGSVAKQTQSASSSSREPPVAENVGAPMRELKRSESAQ